MAVNVTSYRREPGSNCLKARSDYAGFAYDVEIVHEARGDGEGHGPGYYTTLTQKVGKPFEPFWGIMGPWRCNTLEEAKESVFPLTFRFAERQMEHEKQHPYTTKE